MSAKVIEEKTTSVLVVDDEDAVRRALGRILKGGDYQVTFAADASEARAVLRDGSYDLVLTDVNMPGESGLDLVTHIVQEHPDTATVMITGRDDPKLASAALDLGCYGYVIKPFERNEILIEVMNALRRRSLEIENRNHRERLEEMVRARTSEIWNTVGELERTHKELRLSQEETIHRLSIAAEFKDNETARHVQRMGRYCGLLAEKVGEEPVRCEQIRLAALMHDLGKIATPDRILQKPGPLDAEEWAIMKEHSEIGYRILSGSGSVLLDTAAMIALTHHERPDGKGYPRGMVEDEVPIEGRIAAIADVFDAVTSDRVYRKAFSLGEALEIMREGRGDQFDPKLLDIFFDSMDLVLGIKEKFSDHAQIEVSAG